MRVNLLANTKAYIGKLAESLENDRNHENNKISKLKGLPVS